MRGVGGIWVPEGAYLATWLTWPGCLCLGGNTVGWRIVSTQGSTEAMREEKVAG